MPPPHNRFNFLLGQCEGKGLNLVVTRAFDSHVGVVGTLHAYTRNEIVLEEVQQASSSHGEV